MRKKAQSTLELTLSIIVLAMLLAGMVRLFIWGSRSIVGRHNAYMDNFPATYDNPSEFYRPANADLVMNAVTMNTQQVYHADISDSLALLRSLGNVLQGLRNGQFYYNMIGNGVRIISNIVLPAGVDGMFVGAENAIYINPALLENAPESAIAAVLAHEFLHADYFYNPSYWLNITRTDNPGLSDADIHIPGNSIDQEYRAFYNDATAFQQLKSAGDVWFDSVVAIINQGEDFAKAQIRANEYYAGLPEY